MKYFSNSSKSVESKERTIFGLVCSYFQIKLIVLSGYWILCHCCYYYLRRFWISITQDEAVLAGSTRVLSATFRTWSRSIKQWRAGSLHGSCYRYKVALWVAVGIQRFRWRSDLLIRMHEIAIRLNVNDSIINTLFLQRIPSHARENLWRQSHQVDRNSR